MGTPADDIRAGLALADHAVALADRVAQTFGLLDPIQRAARLRARAERIRSRAAGAKRRRQRERLLGRARGLDIRADALAPAPKDPTP